MGFIGWIFESIKNSNKEPIKVALRMALIMVCAVIIGTQVMIHAPYPFGILGLVIIIFGLLMAFLYELYLVEFKGEKVIEK